MSILFSRAGVVAFAVAALGGGSWQMAARGDIVITITQDTVLNQTTVLATGSLDTSVLGAPLVGLFPGSTSMNPGAYIRLLPTGAFSGRHYTLPAFTLPSFGAGSVIAGTFTGPDAFMIYNNGGTDSQLRLASGYVDNAPLTASGLFAGTFATLGITPSPVVAHLPGNQTITVQFATIPTPGAAAALGLGALAGLRPFRRRR